MLGKLLQTAKVICRPMLCRYVFYVMGFYAMAMKPPPSTATREEGEDSDYSGHASDSDIGEDVEDLIKDSRDKSDVPMDASSDVLDDIEKDFDDDDDVGPDTKEKLAAIANKAFSSLTESVKKLKKKQESYPRPKNCSIVLVPKVNKALNMAENES